MYREDEQSGELAAHVDKKRIDRDDAGGQPWFARENEGNGRGNELKQKKERGAGTTNHTNRYEWEDYAERTSKSKRGGEEWHGWCNYVGLLSEDILAEQRGDGPSLVEWYYYCIKLTIVIQIILKIVIHQMLD